jgi:hypothetical protein
MLRFILIAWTASQIDLQRRANRIDQKFIKPIQQYPALILRATSAEFAA